MESKAGGSVPPQSAFRFELGTFEGFNFRNQCAIPRRLTAAEILHWDHDAQGEAEFWPSGDCAGVATVFKSQSAVTATELLALDGLLDDLGGDSDDNYLRIFFVANLLGTPVAELTAEAVEDESVHIFLGDNFCDVRREAAFELFEHYYPELYQLYEATPCDGLIFDADRFLDSPGFGTEEVRFGNRAALLVLPQ